MKEEKSLFSGQMSESDREMFGAIARYRGQTKMGLLRQWIRKAYKLLPVEAKVGIKQCN